LFAGALHLSRELCLLPYLAASGAFLFAYLRWSGLDLREHLLHRWLWGLIGALLSGAAVVANVRSQPGSPAPEGLGLLGALLWLGLVYGLADALLLSVMPVLAVRQAFASREWARGWPGRFLVQTLALAASLFVTAMYHVGYPEFRGPAVAGPLAGNAILTLAYLLSGNPLATILGHVAMHVAAVLHGPESTIQLPPHYGG
jgi:hypothetical protein